MWPSRQATRSGRGPGRAPGTSRTGSTAARPSCTARGRRRGRGPAAPPDRRRADRGSGGSPRRSRPATSGRTAPRSPTRARSPAMPGRSDATTGTPGGDRLEQLLGRRVLVVDRRRLDRHRHDVGARRPVDELGRRHRGQHDDPPAVGRRLRLRRELLRPVAEAEQHQHGVRDLEDRLHRLLDAALGHQLALVEDDRRAGRDAGRLPDQVGPRLRRRPDLGTVHHDGRARDLQLRRQQVGVRLVDRRGPGRRRGPSVAPARPGWAASASRSARTRATTCTRRGCRRSSGRRVGGASARAPATTPPTCRATGRRAPRSLQRRWPTRAGATGRSAPRGATACQVRITGRATRRARRNG